MTTAANVVYAQAAVPFELVLPVRHGTAVSFQWGDAPVLSQLSGNFERRIAYDMSATGAVQTARRAPESADCIILPGTIDRAGEESGAALQAMLLREAYGVARTGCVLAFTAENLWSTDGLVRDFAARLKSSRRTYGGYVGLVERAGFRVEAGYIVFSNKVVAIEWYAARLHFWQALQSYDLPRWSFAYVARTLLWASNLERFMKRQFLLIARK